MISRHTRRERYKLRRQWLWDKRKGRCNKCGIETKLPEQIAAEIGVEVGVLSDYLNPGARNIMATIQHLRNRLHPERTVRPKSGETRYEMWCWKCNDEDARLVKLRPNTFLQRSAKP